MIEFSRQNVRNMCFLCVIYVGVIWINVTVVEILPTRPLISDKSIFQLYS